MLRSEEVAAKAQALADKLEEATKTETASLVERLTAFVQVGPPVVPSIEHPGRIMTALNAFCDETKAATGKDPSGWDYFLKLVAILDVSIWATEQASWQNAKNKLMTLQDPSEPSSQDVK